MGVDYISGRDFRASLRRPAPKPRLVPAFTIQSIQKNVVVKKPPKVIIKPVAIDNTTFKKYYKRGDFPMSMEFDPNASSGGYKISWKVKVYNKKVDLENLDYHHYLPMFFDGLRETEHPLTFFAKQGIIDMLAHGKNKILSVIPQLIIPIKRALNTRHPKVIAVTLIMLQHLVMSTDMVGEALVPYYRQILPPLNIFKDMNVNCGDCIDYTQQKRENVGDLVGETLEVLERYGGEDAFINIKYMIPTYESCMLN